MFYRHKDSIQNDWTYVKFCKYKHYFGQPYLSWLHFLHCVPAGIYTQKRITHFENEVYVCENNTFPSYEFQVASHNFRGAWHTM